MNTLLLNDSCMKELALKKKEKVLDVGSGLGQLTRLMAKTSGVKVLGIERSRDQISEAIRQAAADREEDLAEFREGDARNLPLRTEEWGTFDCAYTRYVLEHVPDPLAVVKEMVKAVRKGGRIVLADDDHDLFRIYPDVEGFYELWNAYMKTYTLLGNDPAVGRKLVTLLHEAGAVPVKNTWVFFGSNKGDERFSVYVENLIGVFVTAHDQIIANKLFSGKEFDNVVARLREWKRRPDSALWFALPWAEGIKR